MVEGKRDIRIIKLWNDGLRKGRGFKEFVL